VVRTLNTISGDTGSISISGTGSITIGTGTYFLEASAPAHRIGSSHKARLQDVTNTGATGTVAFGTSECLTGTSTSRSFISAYLKHATGAKVYQIQHRCATTRNNDGLGLATGFDTEVYTTVSIMKLSNT
jgi:hypothetical protein